MGKENNVKKYLIAFIAIITIILITVYLLSFLSPNKEVNITENTNNEIVVNEEENKENKTKNENQIKNTASESEYEKISNDFVKAITSLNGDESIKPDYKNRNLFYQTVRLNSCLAVTSNYLSDNLASRYDCQKLPDISNSPVYLSSLITSNIEDMKVKSKVKLDNETFRFTYYIKVKFNLEQLQNHGEGSDGSTIKANSEEEFNDVYVDVKNNKIFKTNIDETLKNASVLWDGKSYLNLDWKLNN